MTPADIRAQLNKLTGDLSIDPAAATAVLHPFAALCYALAVHVEDQERRITALEAMVQGLAQRVGDLESPIDGPSTRERIETLERRAYAAAMEPHRVIWRDAPFHTGEPGDREGGAPC